MKDEKYGRLGSEIANLLYLKKSNGHYRTMSGIKTEVGLGRAMERLVMEEMLGVESYDISAKRHDLATVKLLATEEGQTLLFNILDFINDDHRDSFFDSDTTDTDHPYFKALLLNLAMFGDDSDAVEDFIFNEVECIPEGMCLDLKECIEREYQKLKGESNE